MTDDKITLTLPAAPGFVRLARLTMASLATRVGFTYDEVEDLRIAVGEGCSLLIGPEDESGTLTLRFHTSAAGLDLTITREPALPLGDHEGTDLSAQILSAVVDDYSYQLSATDSRVSLNKATGRA